MTKGMVKDVAWEKSQPCAGEFPVSDQSDVAIVTFCNADGTHSTGEFTYSVFDQDAVIEGDILIGRADEVAEATRLARSLMDHSKSVLGFVVRRQSWRSRTIPFKIHPTLPNPNRVLDAIKHWEEKTDVRFIPFVINPKPFPPLPIVIPSWVQFDRGDRCASHVGRQTLVRKR